LRTPVWRRLIKGRPLAARSNGRTHKPSPCHSAPTSYAVGGASSGRRLKKKRKKKK
jgi:hypothetical protein